LAFVFIGYQLTALSQNAGRPLKTDGRSRVVFVALSSLIAES